MLLVVILNAVLAVMIVSVIVALHIRAILTDGVDRRRLMAPEGRRPAVTPEYGPGRRAPRASREPVASL